MAVQTGVVRKFLQKKERVSAFFFKKKKGGRDNIYFSK